jgi:L-ribulose-5-phosphate 3-epimerase
MTMTRRTFLTRTAAGLAGAGVAGACLVSRWSYAQAGASKIRLSACDGSLRAGGPDGLEIARQVGLDGLEVSVGGPADRLQIADPACIQQYKDSMAKFGLPVSSLLMGLLNNDPLASDPRGPAWLEQTIQATKDLGARVILVAFFGKGDLRKDGQLKTDDVDAVVERLKAAAPIAEKAGVVLGIENTLSAQQNLAILDRVKSDAVQVYYDIGNSTDGGYDVPAEIRLLGAHICQFHFKDGGHYLGEGKVKMDPVAEAIQAINYKGWVVLETAVPSRDRDADFKRNIAYVRKLLGASSASAATSGPVLASAPTRAGDHKALIHIH